MQPPYYPNRVRARFSTDTTSWQIIGIDSNGYSSYAACIAAGTYPYPGPQQDFPTGIPKMLTRSEATGGVSAGSPYLIATNVTGTPTAEDDLVEGSGQTLTFENDSVKQVWVKKTVGTDIVLLTGFY